MDQKEITKILSNIEFVWQLWRLLMHMSVASENGAFCVEGNGRLFKAFSQRSEQLI